MQSSTGMHRADSAHAQIAALWWQQLTQAFVSFAIEANRRSSDKFECLGLTQLEGGSIGKLDIQILSHRSKVETAFEMLSGSVTGQMSIQSCTDCEPRMAKYVPPHLRAANYVPPRERST